MNIFKFKSFQFRIPAREGAHYSLSIFFKGGLWSNLPSFHLKSDLKASIKNKSLSNLDEATKDLQSLNQGLYSINFSMTQTGLCIDLYVSRSLTVHSKKGRT